MLVCVCMMEPAKPLRFGGVLARSSARALAAQPAKPLRFSAVLARNSARALAARRSTRQGGRPQKTKRPEQQPLAQSSQQPLAWGSQQLEPRQCSRNRAFVQFKSNSGRGRPRNPERKEKQTPTLMLISPRAAQKRVAARKPSSQIQARTTLGRRLPIYRE